MRGVGCGFFFFGRGEDLIWNNHCRFCLLLEVSACCEEYWSPTRASLRENCFCMCLYVFLSALLAQAIVLFPLALLRFSTAMCFVTLCFVTFLLFGPDLANMGGEPLSYLPPWRQEIISRTGKLYARCALWCFGFYHIKGKEMPGYNAEEARKCTIIANHVSMVDILLFMSLFMPSFAAKASVRNIPLIGRIAAGTNTKIHPPSSFRAEHDETVRTLFSTVQYGACLICFSCAGMQCIFVERLTTKRGNATELVATRQRILSRGDDVPQLCIFPEGTTTNGNYLLPFKTGAFVAGEPVLPVLIRKSNDQQTDPIWPCLFSVCNKFETDMSACECE